jgi:hypothetical protein
MVEAEEVWNALVVSDTLLLSLSAKAILTFFIVFFIVI